MRKFPLPLIAFLICSHALVYAQQTRVQTREAEWKSYELPKTNFTRKRDAEKHVIFRVPADWTQEGATLSFKGPHDSVIKVLEQKVPEGYPLDDYLRLTLQGVRDTTGGAEFVVTRRTQFQNIEAREMVVEAMSAEGELMRRVSWIAIYGPQAFGFNLITPAAHATEVEPYFKAVVQSVIFSGDVTLEDLRASAIKSPSV